MDARPVAATDIVGAAADTAALAPLAAELAGQGFGLTAGVHRMQFEDGRILLTLFVGEMRDALRQQVFRADSVVIDAWDPAALKAVARHCRRGTTIATDNVSAALGHGLAEAGFVMTPGETHGMFNPAWQPRSRLAEVDIEPGHCTVIGAGLAGAAVAASLARRGWRVIALDIASSPASGASGLPAGLLAPHYSPDDSLLSRLSRCGVRTTLQQARHLLREGEDWALTGVLELRPDDFAMVEDAREAMRPWNRRAAQGNAIWHEQAGWIKPAPLVRAWLSQPGIEWRGECEVQSIERSNGRWRVIATGGAVLDESELVVVTAATGSARLLGNRISTHPVRGQVSWGDQAGASLAPTPMNGSGHLIPSVPTSRGLAWYCGSTYETGQDSLEERAADHQSNLERLRKLAPEAAAALAPSFADGSVHVWTGVRCAATDRRPLLGEVEPGLWVSTAMGSRGLTFAALCGELLAARVHGEPFPLDRRLAQSLDITR